MQPNVVALDLFERLDEALVESRRLIAERAELVSETQRLLRLAEISIYSERAAALQRVANRR